MAPSFFPFASRGATVETRMSLGPRAPWQDSGRGSFRARGGEAGPSPRTSAAASHPWRGIYRRLFAIARPRNMPTTIEIHPAAIVDQVPA